MVQDELTPIPNDGGVLLQRQMQRQGKEVTITEAALNHLTEKGFNTKYGARFLKRHIDEKLNSP